MTAHEFDATTERCRACGRDSLLAAALPDCPGFLVHDFQPDGPDFHCARCGRDAVDAADLERCPGAVAFPRFLTPPEDGPGSYAGVARTTLPLYESSDGRCYLCGERHPGVRCRFLLPPADVAGEPSQR